MNKKIRIALPDGNGVFGTTEFWKEYFEKIGVEYVDCETDLKKFIKMLLTNLIIYAILCLIICRKGIYINVRRRQ